MDYNCLPARCDRLNARREPHLAAFEARQATLTPAERRAEHEARAAEVARLRAARATTTT